MARLEIVHQDATFTIAFAQNLQINVWAAAPTLDQMRAFARAAATLGRAHPRAGALWNVVQGTSDARFSEGVRAEIVRLTRSATAYPLGVAHVVLTDGIVGATVRTALSTAILLGRPPSPTKVFSAVAPAAAWLAPRLSAGGAPWSPGDLLAAHAEAPRPG